MDAYLAIVSVRVVRHYSTKPLSEESLTRILEAGRATGSSQNRQPWTFYVVQDRAYLERLAEGVYAPDNIKECQIAVAVTTTAKSSMDVGRCIQNMVVAAWADGIGSSPNGVRDLEAVRQVLGTPETESITNILSLGYPLHPHVPHLEDVEGILGRIKRQPLNEMVVRVGD